MPARKLLEIQRAMCASLIDGQDDRVSGHVVTDGLYPSERLEIYRNTFSSVITTALRLSYPAVYRLVGAEFFEGAARVFISAYPPTTSCLDLYGAEFALFLDSFGPARSLEYLPDVARLEWAVNRALHADDVPPLSTESLARLAKLDGTQATLVPHPSLSTLRSAYPVDTLWRAVLDQDDPTLRNLDLANDPAWLLIERTDTGIIVQRMSEHAWRFTAALRNGVPLHSALAAATDFDPAVMLADHLSKGRFIDVRLG